MLVPKAKDVLMAGKGGKMMSFMLWEKLGLVSFAVG